MSLGKMRQAIFIQTAKSEMVAVDEKTAKTSIPTSPGW